MKFSKSAVAAIAFAAFGLGAATGGAIAKADPTPLPACQFSDGNPDGSACTWTDPATGEAFQVQAHTYGDPNCRDICLGA